MKPVRLGLAGLVVIVFVLALTGLGMGDAPKNDPAPTGAALTASKEAIASGDADVQAGKEEFEEHHCDSCHAIAATGAKGQLGPRMDAQGDTLEEIEENIAEPRKDIAEGYEENLMPTDYKEELGSKGIEEVAKFIKAASTTGEKGGGDGDEG